MELSVGKIVVVDDEVLAGGDAEGKRSACTDVILALGDCGENFGPSGLVGAKAWFQVISRRSASRRCQSRGDAWEPEEIPLP